MKYILLCFFSLFGLFCHAQEYTHQDSLRGGITPQRAWWDVQHYDLKVEVFPAEKRITGSNKITYKVTDSPRNMQIDLQKPMQIDKIVQNGKKVSFTTDGNAHFLDLPGNQVEGDTKELTIHFSGKPKVAVKPPWDGGFTWGKDPSGKPFIANANQGIGASIWWPLKDHSYDEPDKGVDITVTTPKGLMDVSNGKLVEKTEQDNTTSWHWQVVNPINTYGVNVSIADYAHFSETYDGESGSLDLNYYVLPENKKAAREQFKQVPKMLEAFEHWFGPYPFYEDGYKLVEVPYLGMEHQSSVTYGNRYRNGYMGSDLSGTGWGKKFDFIIIHESGHEWFANSITHDDVADMWIHEGFTAYSEGLYLEYHYGKKAGADYIIGTRRGVKNDRPIIGERGVHQEGSGDMYYKAANMIHTLRQLNKGDNTWREILRGLNEKFYHQTISSEQVEEYLAEKTGRELDAFFDQYLRSTMIPQLDYTISGKTLEFSYSNTVKGFKMPLKVVVNEKEYWIRPTARSKSKTFDRAIDSFQVQRDFYVDARRG